MHAINALLTYLINSIFEPLYSWYGDGRFLSYIHIIITIYTMSLIYECDKGHFLDINRFIFQITTTIFQCFNVFVE